MTDHATAFHALHAGPEVLILPNAWDAASAALMAAAGAKAVATSSAAVAWAQGFPDGDALPVSRLIAVTRDVVRVTNLPVTADIEGGYTDDLASLAETIRQVVGAGAVGINLEDGLRDPGVHARKIAAARAAAEAEGVALYINARTDIYLRDLAQGEAALPETLRRAALYLEAGASGIFTPGPADEAVSRRPGRWDQGPPQHHAAPDHAPGPASRRPGRAAPLLSHRPLPRRLWGAGGSPAGLSGDGDVRVVRGAGGVAGLGCGVWGGDKEWRGLGYAKTDPGNWSASPLSLGPDPGNVKMGM